MPGSRCGVFFFFFLFFLCPSSMGWRHRDQIPRWAMGDVVGGLTGRATAVSYPHSAVLILILCIDDLSTTVMLPAWAMTSFLPFRLFCHSVFGPSHGTSMA
ncbi:hypothetical protein V8C35DRAFT_303730 [Trichoderma chlorosporum]